MKVLCGVDGTENSFRALERAVERAAVAGDEVTVAVFDAPETEADPELLREGVRNVLEEAKTDARIRRFDADPGSALVEFAETEGFDEITLGGGVTSPMGKINIGSVTEFVLLNSHVTVSLVR